MNPEVTEDRIFKYLKCVLDWSTYFLACLSTVVMEACRPIGGRTPREMPQNETDQNKYQEAQLTYIRKNHGLCSSRAKILRVSHSVI